MSIKKIASMVGTSTATVSRVLNNPDYKAAPELRENIWKAARELNYVPNQAARYLKMGVKSEKKAYNINILMVRVGDIECDPFFVEMERIVSSEIHKKGCVLANVWYMPVFAYNRKAKNEELAVCLNKIKTQCQDKNDGLIILGRCKVEIVQRLERSFRGIINIVRNTPDYIVDQILCDGVRIAEIAMDYLISLGHRKIAYVGDCHFDQCYRGYIEALQKHNIMIDIDYIYEAERSEDEGLKAMEYFLQMDNAPTAIFCLSDIIAVGMLRTLKQRKTLYFVPSIIACDGIEEGQYTEPMLTTVNLPKEDMCSHAIKMLIDRLDGGHKEKIRLELDGKLLIRGSCHKLTESNQLDYYI